MFLCRNKKILPFVGCFVLFVLSSSTFASASVEEKIKAAYLFNIIKFVEWPDTAFESAQSAIKVCLATNDPFAGVLQPITKRTVSGRSIELHEIENTAKNNTCNVIYINNFSAKYFSSKKVFRSNPHALTIGDTPDFAGRGGMIGFFVQENRVRMEINLPAIRRSGVDVSAKLIEVAANVIKNGDHEK